jgi:large subunit ribosomal protein L10
VARREKEKVVEELTDKFATSKSAILTNYRGLNVAEMTELRNKLRDANVEYKVVKNTLAYLAAQNADCEELEDYLVGPTAIAFGIEDPVAPAQVLSDFAEEHEDLEIKSGVLQGSVMEAEEVESLADIPPREVLLSQIAQGMKAPISGLVYCLKEPLNKMVRTLNAVKEEKEA